MTVAYIRSGYEQIKRKLEGSYDSGNKQIKKSD